MILAKVCLGSPALQKHQQITSMPANSIKK